MDFRQIKGIKLLNVLEHTNVGVVIHALDTSVVYANPTALTLLRLSYKQIIGKEAMDPQWKFVDENNAPLPVDEYPVSRVLSHRQPLQNQIIGVVDGHLRDTSWFSVNGYLEGERASDHGFIVISFVDITDKKNQFAFEDIVHNTQDVVIVTEADGIDAPFGPKIVYVNKAFERLTGYGAHEVLGETPRILQGQGTDATALRNIRQALERQQPCTETILNYGKDGRPYWLEVNIIPLKNRFGVVTHFAAIERDVSSRKYHEAAVEQRNKELLHLRERLESAVAARTDELRKANLRLQRLAHEDTLTGIPNHKAFLDQATQQLARAQRGHAVVGVAILDIDHFKAVNDRFGHDVGDQALCAVAGVLRQVLRLEDVTGRFGGEEFAVCILAATVDTIHHACQRLREAITLGCEGQVFAPLTVSIGVYCVRGTEAGGLEALLKQADRALYQAKSEGRDRICMRVDVPEG